MLPSSQVVDAVIAHMEWPEKMNEKFRRIAAPPCGARLGNWDVDTAIAWMDDNLGDMEETRAAANSMIEAVCARMLLPFLHLPPATLAAQNCIASKPWSHSPRSCLGFKPA